MNYTWIGVWALCMGIALSLKGQSMDVLDTLIRMEMQSFRLKDVRQSTSGGNIDIHYARLKWWIDPAEIYIRGAVYYRCVWASDDRERVTLDLSDKLEVDAVLSGGDSLTFVHMEDVLAIDIPAELAGRDTFSFEVHYEGEPDQSGFGAFARTYQYPSKDSVPVIWTLSEPYGASEWWPCKNSLVDKIDSIDIIVGTVEPNRVATQGVLVDTVRLGDTVYYHWKHRHPIVSYLVSLAVTDYEHWVDTVVSTSGEVFGVEHYVYPRYAERAREQFAVTPAMINIFERWVAPYPFRDEKYGHAQFGWGGGMEHQTISSMGGFSTGLIAHELAHQWFGDAVTCGSWRDIWLNEGFATYWTALYFAEVEGDEKLKEWADAAEQSIVRQPGGSVWVDDTTDVWRIFNGRLTYRKGGYLLHMLRWVLGDTAFWTGVRSYYHSFKDSFARTSDLQRHLEMAADTSLDEFFADWFYGEGYPSYTVRYTQVGDTLFVSVEQETSHASVDFFEMPLELGLYGAGQSQFVRLDHRYNHQVFRVPVSFVVDSVVFDPHNWVLNGESVITKLEGVADDTVKMRLLSNVVYDELVLLLAEGCADGRAVIYDTMGHRVVQRVVQVGTNRIPVEGLSQGAYILRLQCRDEEPVALPFQKY